MLEIYKDPNVSMEDRINDLLGKMTLREKARQMDMYAGDPFTDKVSEASRTHPFQTAKHLPEKFKEVIGLDGIGCMHDYFPISYTAMNEFQKYAVEETRLGIPILMSEEALHGCGIPGSTSFPQAISMASSWNPKNAENVGKVTASEARSKGIHLALAPVLGIAREPRWGRTEETYGEDTYLASRFGVAMCKGMQGESLATDHSIVAEPKHFGGHSMPYGGLNTNQFSLGERDMRKDFLPVFQKAIQEANAMSVMCAYHANDGVPCASDPWLLKDVLRDEWGFKGFVCSDLGAIKRLGFMHKTAETQEDAIAQSIQAGMDMQFYDFEHEVWEESIINSIEKGKLSMEAVDRAVSGILRVKFMLGLFENPYIDLTLSDKVTRCEAHIEATLKAARESMCLLKNENSILPLSKDIKSIAVIGPSANVPRYGDYAVGPYGYEPITVLDGIKNILPDDVDISFEKGTEILNGDLDTIRIKSLLCVDQTTPGILGKYYNNSNLEGKPTLTRVENDVYFNYIMQRVDETIDTQVFSASWEGYLIADKTHDGILGFNCNDKSRVWVDDELVIDNWDKKAKDYTEFSFVEGQKYKVKIEYSKIKGGGAIVRLGWNTNCDRIKQAAQLVKGKDVVIVVVGSNERTCGESMDRVNLDLPGKQTELVQAVYQTGTPTIVVLLNGRPLSINWIAENVPGILEAWYPAEKGGQAISEVLFGDYNPAGRLPITFPKSVGQLPLFYNIYYAEQKDYVDLDSKPLFRFGHGLSYTTFRYSNLKITPENIKPDESVTVSFDLTNTGDMDGDEVIQLYINDCISSLVRPSKELRRFKRTHLKSSETKSFSFELSFDDLYIYDRQIKKVVELGKFEIMVGGSLDYSLIGDFTVI